MVKPNQKLSAECVRSAPWRKVLPWVTGSVSGDGAPALYRPYKVKLLSSHKNYDAAVIPMKGQHSGSIALQIAKDNETKGWAYSPGMCDYVGFLWVDGFEVYSWPQLCAMWAAIAKDKRWKREFAVFKSGESILVDIPSRIARVGIIRQSCVDIGETEEGETDVWRDLLERNWRELQPDLENLASWWSQGAA